jgi:hypothetical protein
VFVSREERINGIKGENVTGSRKQLHDEGLHNLCFSPDITRMMKSRRMRWVGEGSTYG